MLSTKELLVEAKNKILNDGWVQRDLGSPSTGYCSVGALDAVVSEMLIEDRATDSEALEIYIRGEDALRETLRDTGRIANIIEWNDADHRTREDVLELFDAAAQRAAGE